MGKQSSMGQRYAKHQMESGVRLYHQRHYQQAVSRWRNALHKLRSADDKFVALGYLAQAFCDVGDYESMLYYSLQQMELANIRRDDYMKSEAFLNLSKAYERLADFGKAIGYGRASLEKPALDERTPGYAQLAIAFAQMGFSQFQASLEAFEKAMGIASQTGDKLLELQVCVGLGALFTLLRDLSKALIFLRNALSLLTLITVDNVHAKYKSVILYHLSVVLRIKGSLIDAKEACEEAIRLSEQTAGRWVYARSLCSLADINRELGESEAKETITKSWARYEQAFRIVRQINDRLGEVIVLSSMAKSASESRSHYTGQCECQAIQLNTKCLELSKLLGNKFYMLKCYLRLQDLYSQLNDEEEENMARKIATVLVQEMELYCNFCGLRFGINDECLTALRCSHIYHDRCLGQFLSNSTADPQCPKCQCRAVVMDDLSVRNSSISSAVVDQPESSKTLQTEVVELIESVVPSPRGLEDRLLNGPTTSSAASNTLPTPPVKPLIVFEKASEESLEASTSNNHVRSPPPIPRKPNCKLHNLPAFNNELLNHPPSPPRLDFENLEELINYPGAGITDV
ncbi:RING-type domain-containing protein [Aphelenchoides besseyi]|nr:RING-type domain-containing protein [Aphelenchoides besseyi]KAI6194328.1 RING-type domain-containing protein [Aphelenchoides besseyi]